MSCQYSVKTPFDESPSIQPKSRSLSNQQTSLVFGKKRRLSAEPFPQGRVAITKESDVIVFCLYTSQYKILQRMRSLFNAVGWGKSNEACFFGPRGGDKLAQQKLALAKARPWDIGQVIRTLITGTLAAHYSKKLPPENRRRIEKIGATKPPNHHGIYVKKKQVTIGGMYSSNKGFETLFSHLHCKITDESSM